MRVESLDLPDILLITPDIHQDERGFFMETYHLEKFKKLGIPTCFVQDSQSHSKRDVLRGLKFQWDSPTTKLVRSIYGKIFAVAVDIRHDSSTLGKWVGVELDDITHQFLYIPFGYAFGFCVLSDSAGVAYKLSAMHNETGAGCIHWDDSTLGIEWPVQNPIVSEGDASAPTFKEWLESESSRNFVINGPMQS